MHTIRPDEVSRYLNILFADALEQQEGLRLALTCLPSARTEFHRCTEAAAAALCKDCSNGVWAARESAYVGMGLVRGTPEKRGSAADVGGLTAVWADLDIAGPQHKSAKQYPESLDEALAIIHRYGPPPSFLVHSGFGIHAYWLLSEVYLVTDENREETMALWRRWGATVQAWAAAAGRAVDSVWDIARIMRVAGTLNHKVSPPVEVRLDAPLKPQRYHLSDLEAIMVAEEYAESQGTRRLPLEQVGALTVRTDRSPPIRKLEILKETSIDFAATWAGNRRDFKDQSPSAYDMALANIAVAAGWTDQESTDLMISWRRERGHPPKLRLDYYQRTIAKARANHRTTEAIQQLASENNELVPPGEAATPDERQQIIEWLSAAFNLPILRWIRHGVEDATYILELRSTSANGDVPAPRSITIGGAEDILNQRKFRARLLEVTNSVLRFFDQKTWERICVRLAQICECVSHAEDTRSKRMLELVCDYCYHTVVHEEETWPQALAEKRPFVRAGQLHLARSHLQHWLRFSHIFKSDREMLEDLRALGFTSEDVRTRIHGNPINRTYWRASSNLTNQILADRGHSRDMEVG